MTSLTTEPPQLLFDYRSLPAEHQQFVMQKAVEIKFYMHMTLSAVDTVGGYLAEVKARVGHGKFLEWISDEFSMAERTARNWMNVHKNLLSKSATVADFEDVSLGAVYLLAEKSTPDSIRDAAYEAVQNGEKVTRKVVQDMIAAAKPPKGGKSGGSTGGSPTPSANDDVDRFGFCKRIAALHELAEMAASTVSRSIPASRYPNLLEQIDAVSDWLDDMRAEFSSAGAREAA